MQKMAVQTAQSGGARRPRRDEDRAPAAAAAPAYVGDVEGYGNFSRGRDRDSGKGSSYGDTWGGAKGRSGAEGCYNCGEVCSCSLIQPFCVNVGHLNLAVSCFGMLSCKKQKVVFLLLGEGSDK